MKTVASLSVLFVIVAMGSSDNGFIEVSNDSGYAAKFWVKWHLNGRAQSADSNGHFHSGATKMVNIPEEARDVVFNLKYYWFLNYGSDLITLKFSDTPPKSCYKLWGSVFSPSWAEVLCTSDRANSSAV